MVVVVYRAVRGDRLLYGAVGRGPLIVYGTIALQILMGSCLHGTMASPWRVFLSLTAWLGGSAWRPDSQAFKSFGAVREGFIFRIRNFKHASILQNKVKGLGTPRPSLL